jgi:hypothetical protein
MKSKTKNHSHQKIVKGRNSRLHEGDNNMTAPAGSKNQKRQEELEKEINYLKSHGFFAGNQVVRDVTQKLKENKLAVKNEELDQMKKGNFTTSMNRKVCWDAGRRQEREEFLKLIEEVFLKQRKGGRGVGDIWEELKQKLEVGR